MYFFVQMLVTIIISLSPLATGVEFSITLDDPFFEFGTHDPPLIVEPHLPPVAVTTVEATAGHGTVVISRAAMRLPVKMHTVAIRIVGDQVGPAKFSPDDSLTNILPRQCKRYPAARGMAGSDSPVAIDVRTVFEAILVVFGSGT